MRDPKLAHILVIVSCYLVTTAIFHDLNPGDPRPPPPPPPSS